MKKIIIFTLIVLISGSLYFYNYSKSLSDPKNTTYKIDGQEITLHNGNSEISQPNSNGKIITNYFGNEATGDLNNDGIEDTAFLLTQNSGGSGTFYYVVAAIQNKDGNYLGTDAVFIGDRISPQTTEIRDGKLIVNYADRLAQEPMTTPPSMGKSLWLKLDPKINQFGIVIQNFEGETAEPKIPTDASLPINTTLSGTYTCLPFIDPKIPPTEECVFGLKTDDGVYYLVNFGQSASAIEQFKNKNHIKAEGFIMLKEALSTNQWVKYNMKGIFTITKIID